MKYTQEDIKEFLNNLKGFLDIENDKVKSAIESGAIDETGSSAMWGLFYRYGNLDKLTPEMICFIIDNHINNGAKWHNMFSTSYNLFTDKPIDFYRRLKSNKKLNEKYLVKREHYVPNYSSWYNYDYEYWNFDGKCYMFQIEAPVSISGTYRISIKPLKEEDMPKKATHAALYIRIEPETGESYCHTFCNGTLEECEAAMDKEIKRNGTGYHYRIFELPKNE